MPTNVIHLCTYTIRYTTYSHAYCNKNDSKQTVPLDVISIHIYTLYTYGSAY